MTVVGVSAAGFSGLDPARAPDIRVPIQMRPIMSPGNDSMGDRRSQWIQMFARMNPGYTLPRAEGALQPLFYQIVSEEVKDIKNLTAFNRDRFMARKVRMEEAATGYSQLRQSYQTALWVLMGMVALVLLIACFNVANLLIARASSRRKEIAVRLAIGASRSQLIRQLILESLLLSLMGGLAGLVLSDLTIRGLLSFMPQDGSRILLKSTPDARILLFDLSVAVITGILFGLAPAMQSTKLDLWSTLKGRGRRGDGRRLVGARAQGAGDGAGRAVLPSAGRRRTLCEESRQSEKHEHRVPRDLEPGELPDQSGALRLHRAATASVL